MQTRSRRELNIVGKTAMCASQARLAHDGEIRLCRSVLFLSHTIVHFLAMG